MQLLFADARYISALDFQVHWKICTLLQSTPDVQFVVREYQRKGKFRYEGVFLARVSPISDVMVILDLLVSRNLAVLQICCF